MLERNAISWNAIITGYTKNGQNDVALKLVIEMQSGDIQLYDFTFLSVLSACASLELSLVTMYAKHGRIDDASKVFQRMAKKDLVSWTTMTAGYAENGRIEYAHKCP